jgi:hypothetical protein
LLAMLNSPPDAAELEQVAKATLENYSWETTAKKFYQLLKREQA